MGCVYIGFRRSLLKEPLFSIGFFTNRWLLIAVVLTICLQICVVYLPFLQEALHTTALDWKDWTVIILVALPLFIMTELYKWVRYKWNF